jgi:hypothetical protein
MYCQSFLSPFNYYLSIKKMKLPGSKLLLRWKLLRCSRNSLHFTKTTIRCCVQNSLPVVPIMSQMYPLHALSFCYLHVDYYTICLHVRRCSKWSLSFSLPHRYSMYMFMLPHACHMSRQFQPVWFGNLNNIW